MAYTKTDKGLYPAAGALYTRGKGKSGASIEKVEQTITSPEDGGVNVITVTLTDGTAHTFEVRNGTRGRPGATGQDGAPGADGADGNGIESATLNEDYTLTLVFTDGTRYTTPSIRGLPGEKGDTGPQGPKGDTGTFDDSALANYALKADIAATKFNSTSQGTVSYFKIHDFGAWGTGAWYQKGFSMLITSRAGETVWLSVSANDSNTTARAIRLMNTYSKIAAVYYSASESAVYVKANAWVNNICAHILSNVYGDYVPTVSVVSGLASDVAEVDIVEFGPTSSGLAVGDTSTSLLLGGSNARPTYNGNDLALSSDVSAKADTDFGNVDAADLVAKTLKSSGLSYFPLTAELSSSDGVSYTATIPGVTSMASIPYAIELRGVCLDCHSASTQPTLNINGLGAYPMLQYNGNYMGGSAAESTTWLRMGVPYSMIFTGAEWVVFRSLPLSGGAMMGPIKFNAASLPGKSLAYICGVDAFSAGGEMGWQSKSDFLSGCATTAQISSLQTAVDGKQPKGNYAVTNAANTFNGEQKMVNSQYAPTMNDIASGIGCSLKNARACDNQLIVAEVIAPLTAATDGTIGMTSTVGEIPFYKITGASNGQPTGKTQMAKITGSGIYEGTTLLSDKYAPKSHTHSYLPLSGGSITGKLSVTGGAYVSGRAMGGGDDEGIVIGRASNNYAGLTLGDAAGVRSVFYLMPSNAAVWRYNNGSASYDIQHPGKAGTIALTSDVANKAETDLSNVSDANFVGRAINSSCSFFPIMAALDSSDGVTFTATVPGLTSLDAFAVELRGIAMAYGSTSKTPKLNVNGLGAYTMKPFNGSIWSGGTPSSTSWLQVGVPYSMVFNGSEWIVFKYSYTT